jgi:hypothetical protein
MNFRYALLIAGIVAVIGCGGGGGSSSSSSSTSPTAVTVATGSFGAGQHLVGDQITAGRYYTDPSSGCYWERQSGLGGTISEIIYNHFISDDVG